MDSLATSINKLNKRFGPVAVVCMADSDNGHVKAIPTGSASLDKILSIGGVPRGRLTEIYGPPGAGKTSLALSIAVQGQKGGGMVAFIDAEHALCWEYALHLGVDPERFYVSQPDSGEEALEVALGLVQSGRMAVVIIDSIAGLVPAAEVQAEIGSSHPGLMAGILSRELRKMAAPLGRSQTALVVTNQLRHKVGVMFGNPEITCGGNALRFAAAVRLELRRIEAIKHRGGVVGSVIRATVRKSKVGPPFGRAEFGLLYGIGLTEDVRAALREMENGS